METARRRAEHVQASSVAPDSALGAALPDVAAQAMRPGLFYLEDDLVVVEVRKPDGGRWEHHWFVNVYDEGANTKEAVTSAADRKFLMGKIVQRGVDRCAEAYEALMKEKV